MALEKLKHKKLNVLFWVPLDVKLNVNLMTPFYFLIIISDICRELHIYLKSKEERKNQILIEHPLYTKQYIYILPGYSSLVSKKTGSDGRVSPPNHTDRTRMESVIDLGYLFYSSMQEKEDVGKQK